jgi:hypothetical protein
LKVIASVHELAVEETLLIMSEKKDLDGQPSGEMPKEPISELASPGKPAINFSWITSGGVANVVTAVVAVSSAILSVYTFITTSRPPDISLIVPPVVRMTQGPESAWLYVQPGAVSERQSDRIEVITSLKLCVAPLNGGADPVKFFWTEQGKWQYDPDNETMRTNYVFVSDPAPIVVSPSRTQLPLGLFQAPTGWMWEPGTYRVAIVAYRAVADEPVQSTFKVDLPASIVEQANNKKGLVWFAVPTTPLPEEQVQC